MSKKHNRTVKAALAAAVALLVAGCGGGDDGGTPTPPTYTRMVSFGDSLSDVGSYRTAGMQAVFGGGQFTVNDFNPATRPKGGTNWTEQLAHELALPAPCAARTGLSSPATGKLPFLAEPITDHKDCFNYAQGGARVTNPIGPGNAATLAAGDSRGNLGALTEPVAAQIAHHLAVAGGSFTATDLVTVMAGGNDALVQLAALSAAVAGGASDAEINALGQKIAVALTQAGTELAGLVQSQLLAKGAQRVVLVLLPDVGVTPSVAKLSASTRSSISQLALTFNVPLLQAFANEPRVLLVDAYTASELQAKAPETYGLKNVTDTACAISETISSSLFCSTKTVVAADVSRYWFADDVHLTPYGYQLLARLVTDTMTRAGWLAPSGSRPCNSQSDGCTLALPQ